MAISLRSAGVLAALTAIPLVASAQSWPEAGLVAGVGVSSVDSKGAAAGMLALTRSWGPFVSAFGGEFRIAGWAGKIESVRYEALNGQFYCGSRVIDPKAQNCLSSYKVEGEVTGEVGIALTPVLPLVFTTGFRAGSVSEPFVAATIFGATTRERVSWLLRVAPGRKLFLVTAGVVVEFDRVFE